MPRFQTRTVTLWFNGPHKSACELFVNFRSYRINIVPPGGQERSGVINSVSSRNLDFGLYESASG